MKLLRKLFRRILALLMNTFSADCPKCQKHFYGRNKYGTQLTFKDPRSTLRHYRYVCHRCVLEHGRHHG